MVGLRDQVRHAATPMRLSMARTQRRRLRDAPRCDACSERHESCFEEMIGALASRERERGLARRLQPTVRALSWLAPGFATRLALG